MAWLLTEEREMEVPDARAEGAGLWLGPADAERATGWQLKPEGLCRAEVCVPVPPARTHEFLREGRINVAEFWRLMGRPVVRGDGGGAWMLGEGAGARSAALESLEAPDFTLPDLDGVMHAFSETRGKKVFLATWSSW